MVIVDRSRSRSMSLRVKRPDLTGLLNTNVDLSASAAAPRAMTDSEEARKENHHSTVVEEAGGTDRDRNENKVDDVQVWRDWQTAAVISFIECQPSASLPVVVFPGPVMMILPPLPPRSSVFRHDTPPYFCKCWTRSFSTTYPVLLSFFRKCLISLFFLFCFILLLPFSFSSLLF